MPWLLELAIVLSYVLRHYLEAAIIFALLGVYGLIIPPITVCQVLFLIGFSALFTFAIDFPKYYTFRKFEL